MKTLEEIFDAFLTCTSVIIDTRKIKEGSMFFGLKGDRVDGNVFASQAISQGAKYAVVDNPEMAMSNDNIFLVDDVLSTMQKLTRKYRDTFDFPVLSLTGSNGKTTTKELVWAVMSKIKTTYATLGNLNNHIGVPLTILNTPSDAEFLVVEMGANHQGEINFLCQIADPDYVMITNIGLAHLEGFGGHEGIRKGKSEIYRYAVQHNKTIFINTDNKDLTNLVPNEAITEAYSSSSLQKSENIKNETVSFVFDGMDFHTQIYGDYNLPNIAFAIKVGQFFDANLYDIHEAICGYVSQNNRSQVKKIANNEIILDAYNANPSSMHASLMSFNNYPAQNKMAILGDMLELGSYAKQEHQKIIDYVLTLNIKNVIFVGPIFKSLGTTSSFFDNVDEARAYFKSLDIQEFTILLKGSRGITVEKILD